MKDTKGYIKQSIMSDKSKLCRFVVYNILLILLCIIKYVLHTYILYVYDNIFQIVYAMIMMCVFIKIFSWEDKKNMVLNSKYIVYLLSSAVVLAVICYKLENIISTNIVFNIFKYNINDIATWIFIMIEPFMIIKNT